MLRVIDIFWNKVAFFLLTYHRMSFFYNVQRTEFIADSRRCGEIMEIFFLPCTLNGCKWCLTEAPRRRGALAGGRLPPDPVFRCLGPPAAGPCVTATNMTRRRDHIPGVLLRVTPLSPTTFYVVGSKLIY